MPHLAWTARALADLARVRAFYASPNVEFGEKVVSLIYHDLALLKRFPQRGMRIAGSPYRRFSIRFGKGAFVIQYRESPDAVTVVSIRHSRELGD